MCCAEAGRKSGTTYQYVNQSQSIRRSVSIKPRSARSTSISPISRLVPRSARHSRGSFHVNCSGQDRPDSACVPRRSRDTKRLVRIELEPGLVTPVKPRSTLISRILRPVPRLSHRSRGSFHVNCSASDRTDSAWVPCQSRETKRLVRIE